MMRKFGKIVLWLLILVGLGAGVYYFYFMPVPIAKLRENPRIYSGKTIRIHGEVLNNLSLFGQGAFDLQDETGKITVFTSLPTPGTGAKITVEGEVQQPFSMGSLNLTVFKEKVRR